jgi:4-hydroxyproline epimerase
MQQDATTKWVYPKPLSGRIFRCIDAHTCGNPVRLVAEGGPELVGAGMSEKRQYFLQHFDWIRKGLMFEPRGHDMMSGSILYPPHQPGNDVAVLFIETSGCLPMCGHGTIGTITIAIEEGLVQPLQPGVVRMETPAGLVLVTYQQNDKGKVDWVKLVNVPSFLHSTELVVKAPGYEELAVDVSYGGNFYAIVDVQKNFPGLEHHTAGQLVEWGRAIRQQLNQHHEFVHPQNNTIKGCSHVLWTGAVMNPQSTARNAVLYGDKAIDRSPCGTGTSARMAQWYAKGKLKKGDLFVHESIIGSTFTGTIEAETEVNGIPAIQPGIQGWAKIYGHNTISIDEEDDPYAGGFQVI